MKFFVICILIEDTIAPFSLDICSNSQPKGNDPQRGATSRSVHTCQLAVIDHNGKLPAPMRADNGSLNSSLIFRWDR